MPEKIDNDKKPQNSGEIRTTINRENELYESLIKASNFQVT